MNLLKGALIPSRQDKIQLQCDPGGEILHYFKQYFVVVIQANQRQSGKCEQPWRQRKRHETSRLFAAGTKSKKAILGAFF